MQEPCCPVALQRHTPLILCCATCSTHLLGDSQHIDELCVIQQVALAVGQPEEQVVLQLLDLLLVALHLLQQLLPLLLELVLLLENKLAQQLVLKT